MRAAAPTEPDAPAKEGIPRMIRAEAQPASAEARTYFQTAPITGPIPRCIGIPAYQSAETVRIQKETTQATAIPAEPQRSPARRSRPVTANSRIPKRNQRHARSLQ